MALTVRYTVCFAAALASLAVSRVAAADPQRRAFEFSVLGGPAFATCTASCPEVGTLGFGLSAAAAVRLSRPLAFTLSLDRSYFSWSPATAPSEHVDVTTAAIGVRVYPIDLGIFEPWLEFRAGGTSWDATGTHSAPPRGGTTLIPALGADVFVTPWLELGARGSVAVVFLSQNGNATPTYVEGPLIPEIDRIGRVDAVATFVFGPEL